MSKLFNRQVRVTAYQGRTDGQYFSTQGQGIVIANLRVQAEVELNSDKHPNTCHVIIHNCNEQTRRFLESKPLVVRIDAGYDGVLNNLFVGDARYGISELKKTDWETKVQLADGDRAFRFGKMQRSYRAGTSYREVLKDLAASIGQVLPASALRNIDLDRQFATGFTADGPTRDQFTRLLAPFNLNWSFQSGKLVILGDDEALENTEVVIQEPLMIGSPAFGTPDKSKKPPHLTVKLPLTADVVCGTRLRVKSRDIKNGLFKATKVKHHIETHGHHWETVVEALPISA